MEGEKDKTQIPYFVMDGVMARMERFFRITVLALVAVLAIAITAYLLNDNYWRAFYHDMKGEDEVYELYDGAVD